MATMTGRFGSLLAPKPAPATPGAVYDAAPVPPVTDYAPAPGANYSRALGTPTASTNSAIPSYGGAPQSAPQGVGPRGLFPGMPMPKAQPYKDPFGDLDPEHRQGLDDYFNSLAGIDYKGSHESALMRRAQLAQLFRMWEMEPDIDYTGAAPIGRQFERGRNQLQARLAAQGLGGGVAAGAMSDSYSNEGAAIGEYIRRLLAQQQEQRHGDMARFLDYSRDLDKIGLGQNIQEQMDPGFLGDLLGVVGNVAGKLIP